MDRKANNRRLLEAYFPEGVPHDWIYIHEARSVCRRCALEADWADLLPCPAVDFFSSIADAMMLADVLSKRRVLGILDFGGKVSQCTLYRSGEWITQKDADPPAEAIALAALEALAEGGEVISKKTAARMMSEERLAEELHRVHDHSDKLLAENGRLRDRLVKKREENATLREELLDAVHRKELVERAADPSVIEKSALINNLRQSDKMCISLREENERLLEIVRKVHGYYRAVMNGHKDEGEAIIDLGEISAQALRGREE